MLSSLRVWTLYQQGQGPVYLVHWRPYTVARKSNYLQQTLLSRPQAISVKQSWLASISYPNDMVGSHLSQNTVHNARAQVVGSKSCLCVASWLRLSNPNHGSWRQSSFGPYINEANFQRLVAKHAKVENLENLYSCCKSCHSVAIRFTRAAINIYNICYLL